MFIKKMIGVQNSSFLEPYSYKPVYFQLSQPHPSEKKEHNLPMNFT